MKTIFYIGVEWNVKALKSMTKTKFKEKYKARYKNVGGVYDELKQLIKGV